MICFSLWASATVFKTKGNAKSINPYCTSKQHLFYFATVGWLKSFNLQLYVRKNATFIDMQGCKTVVVYGLLGKIGVEE